MCAVKTGNFAIFKTILHAFNQLFTSPVRICSHSWRYVCYHSLFMLLLLPLLRMMMMMMMMMMMTFLLATQAQPLLPVP